METINGCTVIAGSSEPTTFGPEQAQDSYSVLIASFPPDYAPPPLHVHPHTDEAFYIAEGDGIFVLGDREIPVAEGGFVFVPRGTPHTVRGTGKAVRGILIISPGDAEHLFEPVETAG
jgi:mannose-6-phosphate isomerase-like protein (cupin superfamily)